MTEGRFYAGLAITVVVILAIIFAFAIYSMRRNDANLRECLAVGGSWVAENCIVPPKMPEIDAP